MASWKKVIVSGSNAELASLRTDAAGGLLVGSSSLAVRAALDVGYDGYSQFDSTINIGADATANSNIRTNNVAKRGIITAYPASSTRNNIGLMSYEATADSSSAVLVIGGSGSNAAADAPTRIKFATTSSVSNTTNYGITRMSINDVGSVGIGIGDADPDSRLHVRHNVAQILTLENAGSGGTIRVTFSGSSGGSQAYILSNASGGLSLGNSTNYANQILYTTQSRIGVGTSTPARELDVIGSVSASAGFTGSLFGTASWALNAVNATVNTASWANNAVAAMTASWATNVNTASWANNATFAVTAFTQNALTFGRGLSGSAATFNGSAAVNLAISGAVSLTSNILPKWSGTGFVNSNVTDTGTQVQIGAGASSGVSVAAGGINITGNSTFNNNLTVTGDLTVAGTASFTNADNLRIRDKFVIINSGSSTLSDSGWISMYNAAGSGSAFYLEATSAGTYGRFAVAYDTIGTVQAVTADEFVVTAKTAAGVPTVDPTWGGSTSGYGNIYVNSSNEEIFIYS